MNKRKILITIVLLVTVLISFGQIFWKLGANNLISLQGSLFVIFGFICYGSGFVLFIWVLKYLDLSYAYPLVAFSYIWVSLLSFLVFGEHMTLNRWMGVFFIFVGISLIGVGGNRK